MSLLNPPKSSVRDFFLYLLLGGTFYFLIFDFVSLIFSYIDRLLPDVLNNGYDYFASSIRAQLSSLIVLFPVYLGVAWFLRKDLNANKEKVEYGLRKFFIYLTLFLAAIALIGDLITLINYFLDGEITLRFMLKVIVVLATALGVGGYFWYEIKRGPDSPPSKTLAIIASVIALATFVWGLVLAGSPNTRRLYRLDSLRLSSINVMTYNVIDAYWNANAKLPASLEVLEKSGIYDIPKDPETNQFFEYKIISPVKYQLCANFALPSSENEEEYFEYSSYARPYKEPGQKIWQHPAGNHCYSFEMKDSNPNDTDKSLHSVPVVK